MNAPRRIFVLGDAEKPGVREAAARLSDLLLGRAEVLGVDLDGRSDPSAVDADLFIVLGGDGSILSALRRLGGRDAPVLGVNLGKLGFLAGVRGNDLEAAVEDVLLGGRIELSRRMRLEASVVRADGRVEGPYLGLNDAVVERWDPRSIAIDLRVDGVLATTYRGDGLIVATPTGSTAHSLAAGGPIVEPQLEAFVVSPMCAHSVSNRPLVFRADQVLDLRVGSGSRRPGLAVDGQVLVDLNEGDVVSVRRAARPASLAFPRGRTFYDVLRTRLHWAGQPPYESAP